jgi:hypothetical protein
MKSSNNSGAAATSTPGKHQVNKKKPKSGMRWLRNHTLNPKGSDYAQRVINRYRLGMRARGALQGIKIITAPDSCSACQALADTVYHPDQTPIIPIEQCSNRQGCRCTYSPMMTFESALGT